MTTQLQAILGQAVSDFTVSATSHLTVNFRELQGKNVLLYFYPKDNTPGCSQQAQDFRDAHAQFEQLNTVVFGVSRDSLRSHENFKQKFALPFELISDSDSALCQYFGVVKLKSMFGKTALGIERSTFLIDAQGVFAFEWRKVKVAGHCQQVLTHLNSLLRTAA